MIDRETYEKLEQRVKDLEKEKLELLEKVSEIKPEIFSENLDLKSIINIDEVQSIMDDFHYLTNMVTAILDMKGEVIESTGWQDICTKFHRVHLETSHNCTKSDLYLSKNLKPGEYVDYKCKNGLWDVVTPLYVGTNHLGNIFTGQFFYDDDEIDEDFFIKQAEKYGFDKEPYLDAFKNIPRYNKETIDHLMSFLVKFTTYISKISFSNLQLEKEIKKRKRAENALKESEAHMRSLIDSLPDLVWLKDTNGVYLSCNSKFERLFGAKKKDIIGKSDYDFVDEKLADFFRKNDEIAMAAGKPCINEEEVTYADDGHTELLETIKSPMHNFEGKLIGVLGVGRDITERRKNEEERTKLKTDLQQAQKMESVGRLAGGVAHDFNNMLSIIMGNTDMLLEDIDSLNPGIENLQEIQKAAKRSANLTRQLLAFARKQTIAPKVLNFNDAVDGMLKMLSRLIGEDIELAWLPFKQLWPVKIDPSQIDQVLANFCVNARDAIKSVGKVTIETENVSFDKAYCHDHAGFKPGDYVVMAFSDDGCGMDNETLKYLFEPFFTTKENGRGTGLGLATVYGIVKQNKGFINVYSEPGQGTTFKIYFPRYNQTTTIVEKTNTRKTAKTGNETILLVEDEKAILRTTSMILKRLGYKVLSASTPGKAIEIIEELASKDIDLLITDVVMPQMNGRDLSKKILQSCPNIKCLFMSGYTANVIAHHGVLDSDVKFINKPFSKQDLAYRIREVLDHEQF